jgi:hypothetical protein
VESSANKDFRRIRKLAIAAPQPCGHCGASPGQPCVSKYTGEPLTHVPAHWARTRQIDVVEWVNDDAN